MQKCSISLINVSFSGKALLPSTFLKICFGTVRWWLLKTNSILLCFCLPLTQLVQFVWVKGFLHLKSESLESKVLLYGLCKTTSWECHLNLEESRRYLNTSMNCNCSRQEEWTPVKLKQISTAEQFKCECSINNIMFLGERNSQKKLY